MRQNRPVGFATFERIDAARLLITAIIAVIVGIPLLSTRAGEPNETVDPTLVYANEMYATQAFGGTVTDGKFVIWRSTSVSVHRHCTDIQGARIDGGEPFSIGRIADTGSAAVDGGRAVLAGRSISSCDDGQLNGVDGGVWVMDLDTRESTPITDEDASQVDIDGQQVAWIATGPAANPPPGEDIRTIRTIDLSTDGPPIEIASYEIEDGGLSLVGVEGERVYWLRWYGGPFLQLPDEIERVDLMAWTMGGGVENVATLPEGTTEVAVAGDTIVTITDQQPWVHDLTTGESRTIGEAPARDIATDGRYVFWSIGEWKAGRFIGFDLATNARFTAWYGAIGDIEDPGDVYDIDINNGTLAWIRYAYNDWMMSSHAAPLTALLPSAYQPDPGATDPNWTYYPETGHYLAHDFRNFWNGNGGLSVFGFPMTEEFDYLSPETGTTHAAQMTERQRFEWHPENAGTPYTVLLGRLGETILQQQGRDWTTFEKSDPSAEHYFDATGHAIAPEFYDCWASHGLELGHAGVSFDESLALFGYPLSEPMMETNADGDTVLTQYFERAVFEHHPDNPESSQVLLRRLGAELMESWGW